MDDLRLYEEIIRFMHERKSVALATVVETSGATPRKAGAKMLVSADGSIAGTVGGGRIEADTIVAALESLQTGEPRLLRFAAIEESGATCGGNMRVYIEPINAAPRLVAVGSGHVARAVMCAGEAAGFQARLVSPGPEIDKELLALAGHRQSFIFIATSDHRQDFAAALAALKTPARYVAVLGSRRKRTAMEAYLAAQGLDAAEISRIISPAGLEIGAQTPEEIAVSVVGQMIQVRRSTDD